MGNVLETIPALDDDIDPSKVAIRLYVKPKEPTPDPFPDPDPPLIPDPDDPEGDPIPDPDAPMIQPPAPDNTLKARLFSEITVGFERSDGRPTDRTGVHTFAMIAEGGHPNNLPGMTGPLSAAMRTVSALMYAEAMRLEGE